MIDMVYRIALSLVLLVVGAALARAGPVAVVDALGQTLVFPTPPWRIISIAPSVTEILYAVGAQARLVGVSSADDYPSDVRYRPKVGGVQLDFERIASLRPDLVIGVASLQRSNLERLRAMGIRVLAIDPKSLSDTYEAILLIGRVVGREAQARAVVAQMQARERDVLLRTMRSRGIPRVYVEVWDQPFLTAGRGTFVDDLLRRARGRNVFGDLEGWPQVNEEQILLRDPEVVLVLHGDADRVLRRPAWRSMRAVREGRVHALVTAWVARPGPRLVLGLEQIARLLHPEVGW